MTERRRLASLAAATFGLTLLTGLLRAASVGSSSGPSADSLVPVLGATALLCLVGLTFRRTPGTAWLALVAASAVILVDVTGFVRGITATDPGAAPVVLTGLVGLAAVVAGGAAVGYASAPGRRLHVVVGWFGGAALLVIGVFDVLAILGLPSGSLDPGSTVFDGLRPVTRAALVVIVAGVSLGLVGDVRPAVARTRRRLAIDGRPRGTGIRGGLAAAATTTRVFLDEALPDRLATRRAVASAERSRIAAELHAEVVPAIRHALSEAERDGSVERLASSLREVLGEVDRLVASRHSIVLDEFGLLAAIEWLSERTEERSAVRVGIDVMGDPDGARPPADVAWAAFRVTQLALDNVVRHAPTAHVAISLEVRADVVSLSIRDDGPGLPTDVAAIAVAGGHRGLADMRTEAEACHATLVVGRDAAGTGTAVRFGWPAA
jgi:signal transduction histidine kinase